MSASMPPCRCDETTGHCPLHGEAALSPLDQPSEIVAESVPLSEQIAQSRLAPSRISKEPRTGDTWEGAYHRLLADYVTLQQGCQAQGKRLSEQFASELVRHLEHHEIDDWHAPNMHQHEAIDEQQPKPLRPDVPMAD